MFGRGCGRRADAAERSGRGDENTEGAGMKAQKMNLEDFTRLADLFKNFSDPTRLRIVIELADGPMYVQEISDALGMSQSAISHQLRVLRGSRLVRAEKDGKNVRYALDDAHVEDILKIGAEHVRHS
jgi:ArsR family transcriptional regulator